MGGGTPYPTQAQPDPLAVAMAQQAQQKDIAQTKTDLASQTAGLMPTFGLGLGVTAGAMGRTGASAAGGLNGLTSIAMVPLGAGR